MNIGTVANLIPAVQTQQAAAVQKPVAPQPVAPVAAGDSDGDNDGSGAKGILA